MLGGSGFAVVSGTPESLADYAEQFLDRLPRSFGPRFLFDSALLMTLAESWNPRLQLRRLMLPTYGAKWGYQALPLPSTDGKSAWVIDLFCFRGDEHLDSIDLLDYPWRVHELGHLLLRNNPSGFQQEFMSLLNEYMRKMRLLSLSDRTSARNKAEADLRNVAQFGRQLMINIIGRTRSHSMSSLSDLRAGILVCILSNAQRRISRSSSSRSITSAVPSKGRCSYTCCSETWNRP